MTALVSYFEAVGYQFDCLLCAIIFGIRATTISMHAALEELTGARWACWLCAVLGWLVQRDHCADQRAGVPMQLGNYIRAFIGLVGLTLLLFALGYAATILSLKAVILLAAGLVWLGLPAHG